MPNPRQASFSRRLRPPRSQALTNSTDPAPRLGQARRLYLTLLLSTNYVSTSPTNPGLVRKPVANYFHFFPQFMAGRQDKSAEAEGIVLGERAGHSGQYPRRPHDADYLVHSPYDSYQSRATPPIPGPEGIEAAHGADADWGSDEENRP
ncbi:hypothetical protein ACLKA6_010195 [Drosophila palustris]